MPSRETLGVAALLIFALAGFVLIDSWFIEDGRVDPDGEGPEAPTSTFEIAAKMKRIEIDADAPPALEIGFDTPHDDLEVRPTPSIAPPPPRPRAVDPSDWLGRRHFRAPT
jgi:hypothetical protein